MMGYTQIPNLPAVAAIDPDSLFECVVGGQSVKVTAQQIIDSIVGPYLPTAGGTMTGQIKTIAAVDQDDAINKAYVDNNSNLARLNALNVFTQDISISETAPVLILNDTDSTPGANSNARVLLQGSGIDSGFMGYSGAQLGFVNNNGPIGISADPNNVHAGTVIFFTIDGASAGRIDVAGTAIPAVTTVITREKGDARYLQLTGGTVTGQIQGIAPVGNNDLTIKSYVDSGLSSKLTQAQADLLYLSLSGGTVTGQVNGITPVTASNFVIKSYVDGLDAANAKLDVNNTFTADITIAEPTPRLLINDTDAVVGGANDSRVQFYASGVYNGFVGYNSAQLNLETPQGSIGFRANQAGLGPTANVYFSIDGTLAARADVAGTTMPAALTIATREKGDARWAPIASDARLKTNVKDMPLLALTAVMELRPVTYEWIQDEEDPKPAGTRYGLIAQEVQEVLPAAILGSEENYLGLDPLSLIGVLIKAVQELNEKISVLEKAAAGKTKK